MCECVSWHHPVWRAAAKIARCAPDTVFAVFSALDEDGGRAPRLLPAILAAGLGRRAQVIERILASLASLGVTCDGVVTPAWRRRPPADPAGGLSMKPSAVRMRRKRSLDAAAACGAERPVEAASQGVTSDAAARPLEEERDYLFSLSPEAVARKPEPATQAKRRQLYKRAVAAAPQRLAEREHRYFLEHMTAERYERFLARGTGALPPRLRQLLETLFAETAWRGAARPPPARDQPQLLMPISGSRAPPAPPPLRRAVPGHAGNNMQRCADALARMAVAGLLREAG